MNLSKVDILGVSISIQKKYELVNYIENYLKNVTKFPLTIVTQNPEQIVYAQKDEHFRQLLNSADIALPDGIGIVWAAKRLQSNAPQPPLKIRGGEGRVMKVIPGIEFMEDLVKLAAENGYLVGLIGGRNGVAAEALERLQQKFPALKGWAEDAPEVRISNFKFQISNLNAQQYFEKLLKQIQNSETKLLFIGLGAPKQEYFTANLKSQIPNPKFSKPLVLMSVGGSFDELSGRILRAPQWVNSLGIKWLWRLILEPWRVNRQLRLITFIRSR